MKGWRIEAKFKAKDEISPAWQGRDSTLQNQWGEGIIATFIYPNILWLPRWAFDLRTPCRPNSCHWQAWREVCRDSRVKGKRGALQVSLTGVEAMCQNEIRYGIRYILDATETVHSFWRCLKAVQACLVLFASSWRQKQRKPFLQLKSLKHMRWRQNGRCKETLWIRKTHGKT